MVTTKIKLISFDLWETLIFDSKNVAFAKTCSFRYYKCSFY